MKTLLTLISQINEYGSRIKSDMNNGYRRDIYILDSDSHIRIAVEYDSCNNPKTVTYYIGTE